MFEFGDLRSDMLFHAVSLRTHDICERSSTCEHACVCSETDLDEVARKIQLCELQKFEDGLLEDA